MKCINVFAFQYVGHQRKPIKDILIWCSALILTKPRPVTRGVRGVHPNPPFREPPPKNTNPPHLKLSNSITDTYPDLLGPLLTALRPPYQHSIRPSNQVKWLELSRKIVKHVVAGGILLQLTTLLAANYASWCCIQTKIFEMAPEISLDFIKSYVGWAVPLSL